MGTWRIGTDALARSRFAVSALAETVSALKSLNTGIVVPGQRDWLATHAPGYRERIAADPFARALVRAAFRPRWVADFLTSPPAGPEETFADELARVRATPPEAARAELDGGPAAPLPAELAVPDLPDRAAELLGWIWTRTVEPDWSRRRRILEADIVSRTQQLSSGGWASTLDGMRPGMRWLGDGRLQVNNYDLPAKDLAGAQLLFIPSTNHRGWLGSAGSDRHSIVYPCTGILADPADRQPPRALSRLLGPVRAGILTLLDSPKSPTQLVALTGYGYGSVGGHLQVLLDAQLVRRRRSGRSVLYFRTAAGDLLVGAQHRDADPSGLPRQSPPIH
ncbi:transcriptional regulator [Plantactinospora soyae]|uniref:DNA-binding transcriptional ArsR family regulator n=1 Tax=Plantactinospora soyae TaxID=1544732 RepID=A0A927M548_9ACTN|nr:transcriptional regulator [Plantactinospora soyae]MBE1487894.1 DNA-binding transcriptional ArsR family regulator [Plantactinospora soyae]